MPDISPLKAAVLLSKELSKLHDDASRRCVVRMINDIRRSMDLSDQTEEPSSLGKRILKVLEGQKLKAKSIARLCGLSYTGTIRGELASMVKAGTLEKVSGHYAKKCLDTPKIDDAQVLITPQNA